MKPFQSACFVTGAHMDIAARLFDFPVYGSSNPGRLVRQPGGAGLNAASVAASLGLSSSLAGPVGDDAHGQEIRHAAAERAIADRLVTLVGEPSGSYTAIMAPDGEMVIGIADLAIYESVDADWLLENCADALSSASLWFLSTNLGKQTLADLAAQADGRLLAAATISPAKAVRLLPCLAELDLIFTNVKEARALVAASQTGLSDADAPMLARAIAASGVKAGVITQGGKEAIFWQHGKFGSIQPPRLDHVTDVNGAGDALAGAVLAGLALGRSLADALPPAIIAAQLTLASPLPFIEGLDQATLDRLAAGIKAVQIDSQTR